MAVGTGEIFPWRFAYADPGIASCPPLFGSLSLVAASGSYGGDGSLTCPSDGAVGDRVRNSLDGGFLAWITSTPLMLHFQEYREFPLRSVARSIQGRTIMYNGMLMEVGSRRGTGANSLGM